jgi:ABC-2 type transport system ATP-binding protein
MSVVLSVRDVVKTFGSVRAVDGVSFTVRRGTITGLLGRNGAGKTTTIRMITGIFLPDAGSIEWANNPVNANDRVGYLPEERGLYRTMKIVEYLSFLAEIKNAKTTTAKIEQWLRRFELSDKKGGKIEELSKGNQQKVQLIGALLHDPEFIILDEPQSGLDPVNMVLVRDLLQELRAEGRTILLSTHMMAEAERMADDIILVHSGKIVLSGTLEEVRNSFGRNTVHLDFEGDGEFLKDHDDVRAASIQINSAELSLKEGADPQRVLAASIGRLRIRKFELAAPSLEAIFMDKVGAETLENLR